MTIKMCSRSEASVIIKVVDRKMSKEKATLRPGRMYQRPQQPRKQDAFVIFLLAEKKNT